MAADRTVAILDLLEHRSRRSSPVGSLCDVAREITQLTGAGIALKAANQPLAGVCESGEVAGSLIDLEVVVGEGPCTDACRSDAPSDQSDLSRRSSSLWPIYGPLARSAGAGAVFGFPVRIGAVRLGALMLFRDQPGSLTDAQSNDAFTMAGVVARAILTMQAGASPGSLAKELTDESSFDLSVHQAAGMVAVQGSMSVGDALVALRAHAFATGSTTSSLSTLIVTRKVAFDPESQEWIDLSEGSSAGQG